MTKTIMTFLQNQWFRDPARVKSIYEKHPDMRNDLIARFLFAGCTTGKRLRAAFGDELCDQIIWEEVSPQIGGTASSCFPPDPQHITKAILEHKPQTVVALGKIASDGLWQAIRLIDATMHQRPDEGRRPGDPLADQPSFASLVQRQPQGFYLITGPHPADRRDPMPRLREIAEELRKRL